VADILAAAAPSSGLDWLGLILLLDQIPRNCYRDSQAAIAFTVFDPLVQDIAQRAIEAGIPRRDPQLRYRLARRFWFYMPLMHSEDPAVHVKAVSEFKQMASDLEVLTPEQAGADEEEEKVIALLTQKKEEGEKFCTELLRYEIGHQELITKFGRYPYRNEPLGRKSTPEEQAFLDKGPPYF
jgi:mannosyl-oligosaccharide alpha-1,2-mannosidase